MIGNACKSASYFTSTPSIKMNPKSNECCTFPKNPPLLSSECWSIHNGDTGELICGKNENVRTEIASLTKTMTAYLSILISKKLKIDLKNTFIMISKRSSHTCGTSAFLIENLQISIYDILHGLLLPSGNDAAVALAEFFGYSSLCHIQKKGHSIKKDSIFKIPLTKQDNLNDYISIFVKQMNKLAQILNLSKTNFSNPHGLADKGNKSTCTDLGKLVSVAKKEAVISQIVARQDYVCKGIFPNKKEYYFKWLNTNLLLGQGFNGFKTGITPTAGPCLIGTCKIHGNFPLIIILLNCKSCEMRWQEMQKLKSWASDTIAPCFSLEKIQNKNQKIRKRIIKNEIGILKHKLI